jgi:hypothetical protein
VWRADLAELIQVTLNADWLLLLTKRIGYAGEMLGAMFLEGTPDNVLQVATSAAELLPEESCCNL